MSLSTTIYTALSSNPSLVALVADRIYPNAAPQSVVLPYIVYSKISNTPDNVRNEAAPVRNHRYQISVFARSYDHVEEITPEVFEALDQLRQNNMWFYYDNEQDLYEPEPRVHHRAIDFIVREAI